MNKLIILIVALTFFGAGCLGITSDAPQGADAPKDGTGSDGGNVPPDEAGEPKRDGTTKSADEGEAATGDADTDAPSARKTVDVSFSDATGACVSAGTPSYTQGFCRGNMIWDHSPDYEGQPVRVAGEMTWDAETPLTEQMRLMIVVGTETHGEDVSTVVAGHSPLSFDVDLEDVDVRSIMFREMPFLKVGGDPAGVSAEVPQEFHVTGALTVEV